MKGQADEGREKWMRAETDSVMGGEKGAAVGGIEGWAEGRGMRDRRTEGGE